ncbi:hypothetical protein R1flu_026132 [Riccia fluitans]|uniref:Uncharacterized protein n=1 Tax=Riccia fluitans TaxID=41844 RepID=A0ABD1XFN2_9MARC
MFFCTYIFDNLAGLPSSYDGLRFSALALVNRDCVKFTVSRVIVSVELVNGSELEVSQVEYDGSNDRKDFLLPALSVLLARERVLFERC